MKVSTFWLKQLVDLKISSHQLANLLPLRTIGIKDTTEDFIELDMKGYNRADLLSLRGVAYEVAAITGSKISFEDIQATFPKQNDLAVEVVSQKLSPLYCLVKIEGLKVDKSPSEWVRKLTSSGVRSINNITDLTNLAMIEYGQPMHAFDGSKVEGQKIIVRSAKPGEQILTLDGKVRSLNKDLLITDSKSILGIAGVMGGKASEISDATSTILLEAAIFDPASIRVTASRLALYSEAQKRFQHGLTKIRLFQALDFIIKEYQKLGGKLSGMSVVGDFKDLIPEIILTKSKLDSLIGLKVPNTEVVKILDSLHFQVQEISEGIFKVIPPYWRLDISIEEDLIEEIARLYGYEKIPIQSLSQNNPKKVDQSKFSFIYLLKQELTQLGFNEVQTYSFYSSTFLKLGNLDKSQLVKISNPISSETEYLKQYLWPNLVEAAILNLKDNNQVMIFEVGKVYKWETGYPHESYHLSLLIANEDKQNIKQLAYLFKKMISKLKLDMKIEQKDSLSSFFHPARFYSLVEKNDEIGFLAEVHPKIVNQFKVENRIAILEIDLNLLRR